MSDTLDGFKPMKVNEIQERSKYTRIVKAFLDSGEECMGKEYESINSACVAVTGMDRSIKRLNLPINVKRRGKLVLLIRSDKQ